MSAYRRAKESGSKRLRLASDSVIDIEMGSTIADDVEHEVEYSSEATADGSTINLLSAASDCDIGHTVVRQHDDDEEDDDVLVNDHSPRGQSLVPLAVSKRAAKSRRLHDDKEYSALRSSATTSGSSNNNGSGHVHVPEDSLVLVSPKMSPKSEEKSATEPKTLSSATKATSASSVTTTIKADLHSSAGAPISSSLASASPMKEKALKVKIPHSSYSLKSKSSSKTKAESRRRKKVECKKTLIGKFKDIFTTDDDECGGDGSAPHSDDTEFDRRMRRQNTVPETVSGDELEDDYLANDIDADNDSALLFDGQRMTDSVSGFNSTLHGSGFSVDDDFNDAGDGFHTHSSLKSQMSQFEDDDDDSDRDSAKKKNGSSEEDGDFQMNPYPNFVLRNTKVRLTSLGFVNSGHFHCSFAFLSSHIVHPLGTFRVSWDILISLILTYTMFEIPMSLAFNARPPLDSPIGASIFACDMILLIDILLNFRTGYFSAKSKNELVTEPKRIAMHYATSWFLIDLITSLPIEFMLISKDGSSGSKHAYAYKLLRLERGMRLVKMFRFFRTMRTFNGQFRRFLNKGWGVVIALMWPLFLMIFIGHLTACMWFCVGKWNAGNPPEVVGSTDGSAEVKYTSWIYKTGIEDSGIWTQYIVSLYWAVITLFTTGYGDIVPVNNTERLFTIFVVLMGSVVFAYQIGRIGATFAHRSFQQMRLNDEIEKTYHFCSIRGLNNYLTQQLVAHVTYNCENNYVGSDEEILSSLPRHLRQQVLGRTSNAKHMRNARRIVSRLFGDIINFNEAAPQLDRSPSPIGRSALRDMRGAYASLAEGSASELCSEKGPSDADVLLGELALKVKKIFCNSREHIFDRHDSLSSIYILIRGEVRKWKHFDSDLYRDFEHDNFERMGRGLQPMDVSERFQETTNVRIGDVYGDLGGRQVPYTLKCEEVSEFYVLDECDVVRVIKNHYRDKNVGKNVLSDLRKKKYSGSSVFLTTQRRSKRTPLRGIRSALTRVHSTRMSLPRVQLGKKLSSSKQRAASSKSSASDLIAMSDDVSEASSCQLGSSGGLLSALRSKRSSEFRKVQSSPNVTTKAVMQKLKAMRLKDATSGTPLASEKKKRRFGRILSASTKTKSENSLSSLRRPKTAGRRPKKAQPKSKRAVSSPLVLASDANAQVIAGIGADMSKLILAGDSSSATSSLSSSCSSSLLLKGLSPKGASDDTIPSMHRREDSSRLADDDADDDDGDSDNDSTAVLVTGGIEEEDVDEWHYGLDDDSSDENSSADDEGSGHLRQLKHGSAESGKHLLAEIGQKSRRSMHELEAKSPSPKTSMAPRHSSDETISKPVPEWLPPAALSEEEIGKIADTGKGQVVSSESDLQQHSSTLVLGSKVSDDDENSPPPIGDAIDGEHFETTNTSPLPVSGQMAERFDALSDEMLLEMAEGNAEDDTST